MSTSQSLLHPNACGFIKAFLYINSRKAYDELYTAYNDTFRNNNPKMEIKIEELRRRLDPVKKIMQKLGKTSPSKKEDYLSWFSVKEWENLSSLDKMKHLPFYCYECSNCYSDHLYLLPSSRQLKGTKQKNVINVVLPDVNPNRSKFPLKDITKQVFESVNIQFQSLTGVDFATAQSENTSIGLTKTLSKVEKQKKKRHVEKKLISGIENEYAKTAVLRYTHKTRLLFFNLALKIPPKLFSKYIDPILKVTGKCTFIKSIYVEVETLSVEKSCNIIDSVLFF